MIWNLDAFSDNPEALVAYLAAFAVAFVTGIGFHEFSHAWAAHELGDDTAARQGRLTLNPFAHLDPMGTILLVVAGFGWGKPTPVNPYRLRHGVKRGNMMVAAAGPLSNFFFAVLAAIPLKLGWIDSIASFDRIGDASGQEIIGLFLAFVVFINIILGIFNLIPVHPLDGFKVAIGVLPDELARPLAQTAQYGPMLLIGLLALSMFRPELSPLSWIFDGFGGGLFDLIT